MEGEDPRLQEILGCIRACIKSQKGPILLRDLSRDYNALEGGNIPFRQYGYTSLESFLQSFPSLRVCGSGPGAMVEAAASKASSHIEDLISKQKNVKKPSKASTGYYSSSRGFGSRSSRGGRGFSNSARNYSYSSASSSGNYKPPPRNNVQSAARPLPPRFQNTAPRLPEPPKNENKENNINIGLRQYKGLESWQELADNYRSKEKTGSESPKSSPAPYKKNLPPRLQAKKENNLSSHAGHSQDLDPLMVQVSSDDSRHVVWNPKLPKLKAILITIGNNQDKNEPSMFHFHKNYK